MAVTICSVFLLFFSAVVLSEGVEFIFQGFNDSEGNLTREGASIIKPTGALRLTNASHNVIGHAFYDEAIQIIDKNDSSFNGKVSSFSTSFVFAITSPSSGDGGFGFAFTLSPFKEFPGAEPGHYLGIFNETNDGSSSNHIFAVEFDTVKGYKENSDTDGNHVGININGMSSIAFKPAGYYLDVGTSKQHEIKLQSGDRIQAWIVYDGVEQVLNVTISPAQVAKPNQPLISEQINLTQYLKEMMYAGFSAATGDKASSHYILGWSFSLNGEAPALNISQLPLPPPVAKSSSPFDFRLTAVIVALSVFTLILLGALFYFTLYRKLVHHENLEEWELDCPRRFRYHDLHTATTGFKESEMIGAGGFGAVYKGILPTTGSEVAVKKIVRNSTQGMREFAAEIECLGRLRHKNLVNLQGWCKRKNDLLIVYDYVPKGSLDSLIFNPRNSLLPWEDRYKILKGVASGLLYLHEEWEMVVIHRDVKSSNVLIDAEVNPRLSDFGLARLYDHEKLSHTTNVVGTIGYIAPELARTGQVSTSSDVFAYGILLLEVVTGRRPIESGNFILVDWVSECHHNDRIRDAVDPRLNANYGVDEAELVLELGLLCSHHRQEARPSMRQVIRYLNGEDPLPTVADLEPVYSQSFSEINSRMLQAISSDGTTTSNFSTTSRLSTTSLNIGR